MVSPFIADEQIAPAGEKDLPVFEALFRRYPYKWYQRRIQGIDATLLCQYLHTGMTHNLAKPQTSGWVVRRGDEPLAAATLSQNPWHERFYGMRMARSNTFLSYLEPTLTTPMLCDALLAEAENQDYEHLSLRIDGNEYQNLHMLESRGFRLIDVSTKMSARIRRAGPIANKNLRVREYSPQDHDTVIRISGDCHTGNHLFNDPNLERHATRELFRAWVQRCLDNPSRCVYVIEDARLGTMGFVSYLVNRRLNEALGLRLVILDYIVLDTECQGCGIGPVLLEQSLGQLYGMYDLVELRTSQNNYTALSLYNSYGFQTVTTDFILHWSNH